MALFLFFFSIKIYSLFVFIDSRLYLITDIRFEILKCLCNYRFRELAEEKAIQAEKAKQEEAARQAELARQEALAAQAAAERAAELERKKEAERKRKEEEAARKVGKFNKSNI